MKSILLDLSLLIPHANWFIAGGAAASRTRFSDIDVYFYTKADYEAALRKVPNTALGSPLATSFSYRGNKIQFVKCVFGTPEEIFETFDLNKSCKAILHTGKTVESPDFDKPLFIKSLCTQTLVRFVKYVEYKHFIYDKVALTSTLKKLVLKDTISVADYYIPKGRVIRTKDYLQPLNTDYLRELNNAYDYIPKNERPYRADATLPFIPFLETKPIPPYLVRTVLYKRLNHQPIPQMLEDYPDFFI